MIPNPKTDRRDVARFREMVEQLGERDCSDAELGTALANAGFWDRPRRELEPLDLRLLSKCESLDEIHDLIVRYHAGLWEPPARTVIELSSLLPPQFVVIERGGIRELVYTRPE
jgi:hypothetical protein